LIFLSFFRKYDRTLSVTAHAVTALPKGELSVGTTRLAFSIKLPPSGELANPQGFD
jgi:hypothetical protein